MQDGALGWPMQEEAFMKEGVDVQGCIIYYERES